MTNIGRERENKKVGKQEFQKPFFVTDYIWFLSISKDPNDWKG